MTSTDQPSTVELMSQASRQLAQLAREEVHPAQLQVAHKGKKAGIGVGGLATAYVVFQLAKRRR